MLSLDPSGPGLFGLLLCGLGAGALAWRRVRGGQGFEAADAVRLALLLALSVAVVGLSGGAGRAPRTRIVILDRSRSLSGASAQSDRAAAQALAGWSDSGSDDRVALVTCGTRAQVALEPVSPKDAELRLAELLAIPADDWGTDLRGALQLASGLLPPEGGEVFVISDGRDPAAEEGVRELLAQGVPVHCFAPRSSALAGIRVARLEAPTRVARGAKVVLSATLEAARPAKGRLILEQREGRSWREVRRRALELRGGRAEVVEIRWDAPSRGAALTLRVRVRAQGPDRAREDDILEHSIQVGRGRHVVVCGRPLPSLSSRTLSVTNVRPSELGAILRDPPELLVLSEVSAAAVQDAVPGLEAALKGGMGLAVCGLSAFGPGGYAESPLEAVLPVRSGPAQERADRLAFVVCLDASGSMARPAKKSRYLQAIEVGVPWDALRPEDSLGVVLFADQARVAAPLGPVGSELRSRLARENEKLGGGTDLTAGLTRGLELLAQSSAEERVLVLASDAKDEPKGLAALGELAKAFPRGKGAPHVLLVGIEARSLAAYQALADALRPLEVEVARADDAGGSLRSLLQSELAARQHTVRKGRFALAFEPAGEARQLLLPEQISAYVPVRLREGPAAAAQVLGRVQDPEGGAGPWGVLGRHGRGRVAVFPLAGPVATPLLAGLAGELLRPRSEGVSLRLGRGEEAETIRIESREPLPAAIRLIAQAGREQWVLPLTLEGPRQARGLLKRREGLEAGLQLSLWGGSGPSALLLASRSLPPRAHDELALGEPNYELLSRLARESGGVLVAGPGEALPQTPAPQPRPWAPFAAGLAALFVVAELALAGLRAARARKRASLSHFVGGAASRRS